MMFTIFLTFIGFLVFSNLYLAHRIAFYLEINRTWIFYIILPVLTFLLGFGMMGLINSTTTLGSSLHWIAAIGMGFLLYFLLTSISIHLLSTVVKMQPWLHGVLVLGIAALISVYGLWHATQTKIYEVNIPIQSIEKPIRAAHLTDTHIGHFRSATTLQKIVNRINDADVEVVFFTGDLLDSQIRLNAESLAPLGQLKAPVFFVEGNHDVYTGTQAIKDYLKEIGIRVLSNEVVQWNEIQIIGLDHMLADAGAVSPHADARGPNIKDMLASLAIDSNKASILLHHGPDGVQYAQEQGIDLYLAGHTHAGQLWPITHFANMMFEVNKGLHKFGDTQVYVSQGTGTFGPPMRLGTDSELTILNLIPR